MTKYSFVIAGSGWRSFFYVRIAKALPQAFELKALYCRSQEKADLIASAGGEPYYPLKEALQYAYMGILLTKACESGKAVKSKKMPWME